VRATLSASTRPPCEKTVGCAGWTGCVAHGARHGFPTQVPWKRAERRRLYRSQPRIESSNAGVGVGGTGSASHAFVRPRRVPPAVRTKMETVVNCARVHGISQGLVSHRVTADLAPFLRPRGLHMFTRSGSGSSGWSEADLGCRVSCGRVPYRTRLYWGLSVYGSRVRKRSLARCRVRPDSSVSRVRAANKNSKKRNISGLSVCQPRVRALGVACRVVKP
jgi:hypothetical protein